MTNEPLICLCRNRFGTRGLFGDGGEADQKQESSCGRRIQASSMHRKSNTFQPAAQLSELAGARAKWSQSCTNDRKHFASSLTSKRGERDSHPGKSKVIFLQTGNQLQSQWTRRPFSALFISLLPSNSHYLASHSQGWSSPTFDCNVFRRVAGQVLWHHSRNLRRLILIRLIKLSRGARACSSNRPVLLIQVQVERCKSFWDALALLP